MDNPQKILIVDDISLNCKLLYQLLKGMVVEIKMTYSGKDALEILDNDSEYDLILMDVQMPGMDGFVTVKQIKENESLKEIPVIFITAYYNTKEFIQAGYNLGAYDYITKPFDNEILKNKVKLFLTLQKQKKIIAEYAQKAEQYAKAQKLSSIGQLAAGIAHEINTPMQYIGDNNYFFKESFGKLKEYVQELENRLINPPESPFDKAEKELIKFKEEKEIDYLMKEIPIAMERTEDGINRVRNIISAMKKIAHPSGQQKTLSDINQAIEITSIITRNEWKYIADLELIPEPGLPPVKCLIDEINQVILNLIINSSHAIEEQVKKNIYAKGKITISTHSDSENVEIKISDNGCGIPSENLEKIFNPLFTTKDIGKGTGQGLAIALDIIENKHRGKINVESILEKGTTFTLLLPK
ncbi:MAG: response regulator [FCB group bacterium]|jgi:signal transduction histidine kinase